MRESMRYSVIVLLIAMLFLSACSSDAALQVVSFDYPDWKELKAEEIDRTVIENWAYPTENPYYGNVCHVSLANGALLISNRTATETSFSMEGNNGYFLGVDLGEFDGWVRQYPYYSTLEEAGESSLVTNENCRGFVKIDNTKGYLFTWDGWQVDQGTLYVLSCPEQSSTWSWEKVADLNGVPLAFVYEETSRTIYVATYKGLSAYSVEDGTLTTLTEPELWSDMCANSIVKIGDKLYVGMAMGIYEYNLTQKTSVWYPADYEAWGVEGKDV